MLSGAGSFFSLGPTLLSFLRRRIVHSRWQSLIDSGYDVRYISPCGRWNNPSLAPASRTEKWLVKRNRHPALLGQVSKLLELLLRMWAEGISQRFAAGASQKWPRWPYVSTNVPLGDLRRAHVTATRSPPTSAAASTTLEPPR